MLYPSCIPGWTSKRKQKRVATSSVATGFYCRGFWATGMHSSHTEIFRNLLTIIRWQSRTWEVRGWWNKHGTPTFQESWSLMISDDQSWVRLADAAIVVLSMSFCWSQLMVIIYLIHMLNDDNGSKNERWRITPPINGWIVDELSYMVHLLTTRMTLIILGKLVLFFVFSHLWIALDTPRHDHDWLAFLGIIGHH